MKMINRAFEDADAFRKMLEKATGQREEVRAVTASSEVQEWNAAVERKRSEKKVRRVHGPAKAGHGKW